MTLENEQISYINNKISEGVHNDGNIIEPVDKNLMAIILFNPLMNQGIELTCPFHDSERLMFSGGWTHNSGPSHAPRLLYHVGGNVLLISAMYRCNMCKNKFLAHHPRIMNQRGVEVSFHLLHKSGFTQASYDTVINLVQSGMTFTEVSNFFQRANGMKASDQTTDYSILAGLSKYKVPSRRLCTDAFLEDFRKKLPFYEAEMASIKYNHISIDHTFKVSTLLKVVNDILFSSRRSKPFEALFIVLDEGARVCSFTLTCTKSLDEIQGNLTELMNRSGQPKMIHSDLCCQDSSGLKNVFGDSVEIKLDIFHGISRVTREVKKKDLNAKDTKLFNHQLSMCVRQKGDWDDRRKEPTAPKTRITENLEKLKLDWKEKIPVGACKAIENLIQHARAGCLSSIPVSQGTNKNELLHRHLRQFLSGRSEIGAEALIALLTTFFYRWNCSQSGISQFAASAKAESASKSSQYQSQSLFGFPYHERSENEEYHTYDTNIVDNIVNATERLAELGKHFFKRGLVLNAEDILLRSPFKGLPTISDIREGYNEVDKILSGMGLKRIPIHKDGNCCFAATSTMLLHMWPESPDNDYGKYLASIGLRADMDVSIISRILRNMTVKELLYNYREYRSSFPDMTFAEYRAEVTKYYKNGEFAGLVGDMILPALSNVLRSAITLYCDNPLNPVQFVKPRKSIFNEKPIELVFIAIGPGHYDALTKSAKANLEERLKKQKRCRCGRSGGAGCISRICSCYNLGVSCNASPSCYCLNCSNKWGKRGSDLSMIKPCNCGKRIKVLQSGVSAACTTTNCKCFLGERACSDCHCKGCNNPHGKKITTDSPSRRVTKQVLASRHSGKVKRIQSRTYILDRTTTKVNARWKLTESILLSEIFNHLGKDLSVKNATRLFNHIIQTHSHLGTTKTERSISHKQMNIYGKIKSSAKSKSGLSTSDSPSSAAGSPSSDSSSCSGIHSMHHFSLLLFH